MKTPIVFCLMLLAALVLAPATTQARFLNPGTGRFQTMDSYEGNNHDHPVTMMRACLEGFGQLKLFKDAPPKNRFDPRWDSSGNDTIGLPTLE